MEPYQKASEEIKRQGELPINLAKTVASTVGTAGAGLSISKVMPLLSKYVPSAIAIAGLNKLDPRLGKFIKKAQENGTSFDDIREFISNKAEGLPPKTDEETNIIKQYSPKLYNFILDKLKKGEKLSATALNAYQNPEFKSIINQIERDHKADFMQILSDIFGAEKTDNAKTSLIQEVEQPQTQTAQVQPGAQPQGGQLPPDIVNAMQQMSERMKKLRGG